VRRLVAVCAVLLLSTTAHAFFVPDFSSGPIVFDFEDGLQGWRSYGPGSVHRVQTQLLGGQWAIFGDGLVTDPSPTALFMEVDITEVGAISVEQFFAGDASQGTDFVFLGYELIPYIFVGTPFASPDPLANPGLRVFDVSYHTGFARLGFLWRGGFSPNPDDPAAFTGLIDNITFYPLTDCSDGIDNDGDTFIDYPADPGCRNSNTDFEDAACQDGTDNDGDTLIDFDGGRSIFGAGDPRVTDPDPECMHSYKDNEAPYPLCGLGVELALLLPLLWLWRRPSRQSESRRSPSALHPGRP
jgi:hypothetical protein